MELILKHATIADAPALAAMNRQLADDERSRNPMTVDALTTRMEKWLGEDWQAVIFLDGLQTIGYALFQIGRDYYDASIPEVYVRQFFVAQDRRRQGIGRRAWAMLGNKGAASTSQCLSIANPASVRNVRRGLVTDSRHWPNALDA